MYSKNFILFITHIKTKSREHFHWGLEINWAPWMRMDHNGFLGDRPGYCCVLDFNVFLHLSHREYFAFKRKAFLKCHLMSSNSFSFFFFYFNIS